MKNRIFLLIVTCFLLSVSCNDQFLEEKRDYSVFAPGDIFSDPNQANAVFAQIYKKILGKYNAPMQGADILMRQGQDNLGGANYMLTEELASGYPISIMSNKYRGAHDKVTKAGNHLANPHYWNYGKNSTGNYNEFNKDILFPSIYLVNSYIAEIDRYKNTYPMDDPNFWDKLKGQSIFVRAWLYFDAVRLFGGVPYYSTGTNDVPSMDDRSERMSIDECIEKICADFTEAAGLLPAKWDTENQGRFTSVAALAMVSRARLYAASPVFNANWDNPQSKRWQAALEAGLAAEQAAIAVGYGVSVNDINSWDQAFYGYAAGSFNPEAIIMIPKSSNTMYDITYSNKWESHIRPQFITSVSGAGLPVPKEMIDLFPMKDGSRPVVGTNYDAEKFYRDRDPRFYRTFAFSGCEWPGTTKQIWLYAYKFGSQFRYTDGTAGDAGAQRKSKAIVWKMTDSKLTGDVSYSGTDILEYRYAELLLNIAECYAVQGNAGKCIEYLSKIRQRVGINSANNYGIGNISSKYALIEACLYERRVELAYEGKRSWDTRRWLLYEGGAGFDPVSAGVDGNHLYNPEQAWGAGWKLYNGKNGKPEYTKANNILTKLGLSRISGTKHIGEIWGYQLTTAQATEEDPLTDNADRKAVPPIKREMSDAERNAAFDKLDAFYTNNGFVTNDAITAMGTKYGMDSGTSNSDVNFLFSWRGWYYVYPLHYDLYDSAKGNTWLAQTEGWMIVNASNGDQDGTYVYCTPE
ncbi:MAG: RagB/SusD family nutrient uptake outer membrane protein [Dysgonamonadaceae bacterium]|nr:RagB/SusD family nutrient uptake outer membrane protein [Dysgonamonadaceae bacterium]